MQTLTLSINDVVIPLPADFSMRVTWRSPVCDFDKIPSGYGLGISFPENKFTRTIFGNPQRVTKRRSGNDQKFPGFAVRVGGTLLMNGTLKINDCSNGRYEAVLVDQVGVIGEKEQERSILDIARLKQPIPWVNSSNYDKTQHPYCCFPIVNKGFFKDKGIVVTREHEVPDPNDTTKTETKKYDVEILSVCFYNTSGYTVNYLNADKTVKCGETGVDLTVVTEKNNTYENSDVSVVTPFFFLKHVVSEALADGGFRINPDKNILAESEDLSGLCIYNNYDMTKTEFGLISADFEYLDPHSQDMDYDPERKLRSGEDAYQDSDGKKIDSYVTVAKRIWKYNRSHPEVLTPRKHLPKMKVGDLLLSTQNMFNVCFHFLPNNKVNVFSRDQLLIGQSFDLDSFFTGKWSVGEKMDLTLKFNWSHDNGDVIFSEEFVDLSDRRDDIKEPRDNWGDLFFIESPEEGEIRYLRQENIFVEYKWTTIAKTDELKVEDPTEIIGWVKISIGWQSGYYNYGRDTMEEITSSWSTCYGRYFDFVVSKRGVRVDQAGNMDTWKAKFQDFTPRLLLYNGYNVGGNENSTFALDWEKPGKGILDKFWKYFAKFWANRLPIAGDFDLPVNVLKHVVYNICSKYRTSEGEFFIEEMSTELYVDRIGLTHINGYKVDF